MPTRILRPSRIACFMLVAGLIGLTGQRVFGRGDRIIEFPPPPDPRAIGTQFGSVNSYVTSVSLSSPESIHRLGLSYSEIRGTISGIGWGGSTDAGFVNCPYTYELPYVLRIPPAWSGGLVIYRHQHDSLASNEGWEAAFGSRSFTRVDHESADRYASDVALHPNRRWAFFAVNQNGVLPGGVHDSVVLAAPGCSAGTPIQSDRDVPVARDHARLAQYLLHDLRGRAPTMTLGVGFVQGAGTNFALNAGVRRPVDTTPFGDNHQIPYDTASGLIFDGFLAVELPGNAATTVQSANLGGLSAPTIFVIDDASFLQPGAIFQVDKIRTTPGLSATNLSRVYSIRNMPLLNADFSLRMLRDDIEWINAVLPGTPPLPGEYFTGTGEQLKPVTAALLDHLADWVTRGIAPPTSLFNGEVKTGPDRIEFYRTTAPATSFPYVDDAGIDVFDELVATTPNANQRAAWSGARTALTATIGSIVLPETACRRGLFAFRTNGPVGTSLRLFTEPAFLARWAAPAVHQDCRVQTVDALVAAGVYDPLFVTIDVDPDHSPNVIDPSASGRLPVAIFSTEGFDATDIVPGQLRLASISFQGEADNPGDVRLRAVDLNRDGRDDVIAEFRIDRLRFHPQDVVLEVWGATKRGGAFAGTDVFQLREPLPPPH